MIAQQRCDVLAETQRGDAEQREREQREFQSREDLAQRSLPVDFDPLASGDNYVEAGLVVASVPVPNSMLLAMSALMVLAALRRPRKGRTQ